VEKGEEEEEEVDCMSIDFSGQRKEEKQHPFGKCRC